MNYFTLPLEEWTNNFVYDWLIPVLGGFFEAISDIISFFINGVADIFTWIPAEVMAIILILLVMEICRKRGCHLHFDRCILPWFSQFMGRCDADPGSCRRRNAFLHCHWHAVRNS